MDTYPNQIEVIASEQMLDAYASVGLPISYTHWSYGKEFIRNEEAYRRGMRGLAYELVINSDPCIAYLMEDNSMPMQALVIAHACYGHNSFFKGNYLFKQWTSADAIVDYMVFARKYIFECEQKYGIDRVEETLDACHALKIFVQRLACIFLKVGACDADALYFTVATLTTTGFGDITMSGPAGKLFSVFVMVVGVALFVQLARAIFQPQKVRYKCKECGLLRHDLDAVHCKHCGTRLKIETPGIE